MVDAAFRQHVRRKIPLHRVHLRKRVRDRRAGGEHYAAPVSPLLEITRLQEHVECAIAIGVRQAGDPVHLGRVGQVLVEVGFVNKQLIDAELLKGESAVFRLPVGSLLQPNGEPLLCFFQLLYDAAVIVFRFLCLPDFRIQFGNLLLDEPINSLYWWTLLRTARATMD